MTWLEPDAALVGATAERLLQVHVRVYVGRTSTAVATAEAAHGVRFESRLRGAGEDQLCWIDLARAGRRSVISAATNVTCGSGYNLFFKSYDFGSVRVLEKMGYLFLF